MSHYEERLERDLNRIRGEVGKLAQRVEGAVKNAVHALLTGNDELAAATILADGHINRGMRRIDRLCHSFIAVHLPSAGHLRLISSIIRANILLERIGDYAVTICRELPQLSASPQGAIARGMESMAQDVRQMLHQSIEAFEAGNAEMARGTMAMARQVQDAFSALFPDLLDESEPYPLRDRFALFVVFHRLERMADQAKNLCEEAVFSATGEGKAAKVYRVLFIDEDDTCLSQMARAIARAGFPNSGLYSSAGSQPGRELSRPMKAFLDQRGIKLDDGAEPRPLDCTPAELAEFHVVVSLQGPVKSRVAELPFHTVGLSWDVGGVPDESAGAAAFEECHRKLAIMIRDLMVELRGEDAN